MTNAEVHPAPEVTRSRHPRLTAQLTEPRGDPYPCVTDSQPLNSLEGQAPHAVSETRLTRSGKKTCKGARHAPSPGRHPAPGRTALRSRPPGSQDGQAGGPSSAGTARGLPQGRPEPSRDEPGPLGQTRDEARLCALSRRVTGSGLAPIASHIRARDKLRRKLMFRGGKGSPGMKADANVGGAPTMGRGPSGRAGLHSVL